MAEMTSQEIDQLTTGDDEQVKEQEQNALDKELAADALAASESAAAEPSESDEQRTKESDALMKKSDGTATEEQEQDQQAPAIGGAFKRAKQTERSLKEQLAESNQQLIQLQQQRNVPQQQVAPPEKSPEEKYLEEHPDMIDMPFPARVAMAQRNFDREQAAQSSETQRQTTEQQTVASSVRKAAIEMTEESHGVGLQNLLSLGGHLLTQNDNAIIFSSGEEAGQQMYDILVRRIKATGGPLAADLQTKISATTKTTVPATPKAPTVPTKPKEEQVEEVELAPHVADIMQDLDL